VWIAIKPLKSAKVLTPSTVFAVALFGIISDINPNLGLPISRVTPTHMLGKTGQSSG